MTVAATSAIDRAFEEAMIQWISLNVNADWSETYALPVGFGDCALLECTARVFGIATIQTLYEVSGPTFTLMTPAGADTDLPFSSRWILETTGTAVCARAAPDQVQFWREHETLRVTFPEIDTNASPTGDLIIYAKVRRLRPEISRTPEETHFFLTS